MFVCLLLHVFFLSPLKADQPKALLQEANRYVSQKDYENAIKGFESILKQFPESDEAKQTCQILPVCYAAVDLSNKIEAIYLYGITHFPSDKTYVIGLEQSLADFYIKQKKYQEAIEHYTSALNKNPDCKTAVILADKIVSAYTATGNYKKAGETLEFLLNVYPKLSDEYAADTLTQPYHRNRIQVDKNYFIARTLNRIALFYQQANQQDTSIGIYQTILEQYPDFPQAITASYAVAQFFNEKNQKTKAIPYYLKAITGSTTFLISFKAASPENQIYIEERNKHLLTSTEITKALKELYFCEQSKDKHGTVVSETEISQVQILWQEAHTLVGNAKYKEAINKYSEIAEKTKGDFSILTHYLIALCYSQESRYTDALKTLEPYLNKPEIKIIKTDTPSRVFHKTITAYSLQLAGLCYFNQGNYTKAEKILKSLMIDISPSSAYLLAQTYEFQGEIEKAIETYKKITKVKDKKISDLSTFAIGRINSLKKPLSFLAKQKKPEGVYVGEDRMTKGNWKDNYGEEIAILCGFNAPADWVESEEKEKFKYEVYTNNPEDPARTWVSKSFETEECFLQFPGEFHENAWKRRPCNWDDHGEVYPVGTGPDLFVSLSIPAGRYRLSLYFLNDPNYYEPNRQYTVYIQDKQTENILSATSVEDFYSGVYKNFIVTGPEEIVIHICRNLSLNILLSGIFLDQYSPEVLPEELWTGYEGNPLEIQNKITDVYNKAFNISKKQDFTYTDFENYRELWDFLSEELSFLYQKEPIPWDKMCIGFTLAYIHHQNWQYKKKDDILQEILKNNWQQFPTFPEKETDINEKTVLISLVYKTYWINQGLKLEFTKHLADNIAKSLPPEKVSFVLHQLIKTITSSRAVYYQPWVYQSIIYEKLIESKLADITDMFELGRLYSSWGDPNKALPVFQQIINSTDNKGTKQSAYLGIMFIYWKLLKEEEMRNTLHQLQSIDPFSSQSQEGELDLHQLLCDLGKEDEAYEILKNFASKYPDSKYLPLVKKQLESIENK